MGVWCSLYVCYMFVPPTGMCSMCIAHMALVCVITSSTCVSCLLKACVLQALHMCPVHVLPAHV